MNPQTSLGSIFDDSNINEQALLSKETRITQLNIVRRGSAVRSNLSPSLETVHWSPLIQETVEGSTGPHPFNTTMLSSGSEWRLRPISPE